MAWATPVELYFPSPLQFFFHSVWVVHTWIQTNLLRCRWRRFKNELWLRDQSTSFHRKKHYQVSSCCFHVLGWRRTWRAKLKGAHHAKLSGMPSQFFFFFENKEMFPQILNFSHFTFSHIQKISPSNELSQVLTDIAEHVLPSAFSCIVESRFSLHRGLALFCLKSDPTFPLFSV